METHVASIRMSLTHMGRHTLKITRNELTCGAEEDGEEDADPREDRHQDVGTAVLVVSLYVGR